MSVPLCKFLVQAYSRKLKINGRKCVYAKIIETPSFGSKTEMEVPGEM